MRHFQEGGYSRRQFKDWVIANGIYDKKGSSIATMTDLILELTERGKMTSLVISTLGAIALIWLSIWEPDPRKAEEFPLQPTRRATRIYNLALALYSGQPHTFRNKWQPEKRECVEVGELIESWRSIVCPHSLAPQP